ncbi:MAG: hypothetical protein H6R29_552, partial [Methanomicrobia archaeon]|nr:hypothetical protein [Methanomicrobia archaeon]
RRGTGKGQASSRTMVPKHRECKGQKNRKGQQNSQNWLFRIAAICCSTYRSCSSSA